MKIRRWLRSLALGITSAALTTIPVAAAERIYLTYGPLNLSVRVASLETFAKDGTVDKDLAFYLNRATPEQQAKFREALLKSYDVNPILIYRFFNSNIGEDILFRIGKLVTIQGGINGKYALRGAMIQAAAAPEKLSLLNFLKKFPTNMQFDGEQILTFSDEVERVLTAIKAFDQVMRQLSTEEATTKTPVNYTTLPDIRKNGPLSFQKETWMLNDESRNRQFYVIVYKPQSFREGKTPVVIISHGLASRPEDFANRAEHLASYGYVVALPQHPGSDYKQAQAVLGGYSREVFALNEFIDRPKDISFVIDELERRNQSQFAGRLNLEEVGVFGHSFGGYTVLAVAGAEIDFENLEQDCKRPGGGLDLSLLLQCQALNLPRQPYNFRDERVQAVVANNPVNRSIFGSKGLSKVQIPVILGAGSYDPATPDVFEQVPSFIWLTTPNKYLALAEGEAHVDFSQLDAGITKMIDSVPNLTLPSPDLLISYGNGVVLPFFEVYIADNDDYRPYLSSAYAAYLSEKEPFKLYLISAASSAKLSQAIEKFKQDYGSLSASH